MIRVPTDRPPTRPGEVLRKEFLRPMGVSQRTLTNAIGVPYQRVNELVNGHRGMTASTALRFAKFFGTSAAFWMNLQVRWDLYHTQKQEADRLSTIQPYVSQTPETKSAPDTA
ncbi:MAG: HigA family addiction module antitoxin [Ardenticatenaceae bacterium]